jgi:hypothetical protein
VCLKVLKTLSIMDIGKIRLQQVVTRRTKGMTPFTLYYGCITAPTKNVYLKRTRVKSDLDLANPTRERL